MHTITPHRRFLAVIVAMALGAVSGRTAEAVDFVRDVVPALTKVGCNSGACHGSFQGRGGFALSLLGFDPPADYDTIFKAARGRRVEAAAPEQSLLLRKATGAIPHGGGKKLTPNDPAYRLVRDYLAAGSPAPMSLRVTRLVVSPADVTLALGATTNLNVRATWSDGVTRDVTAWTLFDSRDATTLTTTRDGAITPLKPGRSSVSVRYMGQVASVAVSTPFGAAPDLSDFTPRNYIDELVLAEWKRLGVRPARLTTDAEFLRRVSLDLTGTLPTADEVRRFLADPAPDKRAKRIDELLDRPEYADYWALKWGDLLRVHRRYVGVKGLGSFAAWVRRSVRENVPLDRVTRELLTAQGDLFSNGPVAFYFVDQKPDELAETTAQVFLGVRLQCARCHHHPMEVWSQDDYWSLAAFFTRLEVRENNDQGRFGGMRALRAVPTITKPLTVPAEPRTLGGATVTNVADPRTRLAEWVTHADNPYFARNFANRYWAYLTGRGIVEPLDDLRETNPPSNPALLNALAADFTKHGFDAKHLIRTICNSRVYQLASELAPTRDRDGSLFTHRVPARLSAEVLLDAVNQACGSAEAFEGTPPGTRAIALPDPSFVSSFLTTFGRSIRNNPCECARDSSPDLLQALHLANGMGVHQRITAKDGRVSKLLDAKRPDDAILDELYLTTLGREPTATERREVLSLIAESPTRREGWEDLLWTLLNSPEFSFNH